ncbi:hypothetical protein Gohar_017500, partial [Gossypium harknessii]|nr:hypothetical protein [Gossypium harknessii]
ISSHSSGSSSDKNNSHTTSAHTKSGSSTHTGSSKHTGSFTTAGSKISGSSTNTGSATTGGHTTTGSISSHSPGSTSHKSNSHMTSTHTKSGSSTHTGSSKHTGSFTTSGHSSTSSDFGSKTSDSSKSTSSSKNNDHVTSGSTSSPSIDYGSPMTSSTTTSGHTNSESSTSNNFGSKTSGSFRGTNSYDAPGSTNLGISTSSDISMGSGSSKSSSLENQFSGTFSKVFAFGDSYTDTGNAQSLGILKDFASAFLSNFFQTIDSNLHFEGRSSNGRLVIDFLCDSLNISLLPPFEVASKTSSINEDCGVNFAVGGSTSLSGDFFTNHKITNNLLWQGTPLGFQTQIEWFNQFVTKKACNGETVEQCKEKMGNNLIWLGQMGADDFARVIGSSISLRWLTDITLGQISKILTTVLDSGARFIVVQGLPPLGCWPLAKLLTPHFAKDEMGCSAVINKAITAHNDLLQKTLEEFRRNYPNATIAYADYFNAFKTVMGNLTEFGFSDGSGACCGVGGGLNFNLNNLCGMDGTNTCSNPNAYIYWDGLHLTEAMNKQIARLFLLEGFCQPSFVDLIKRHQSLLQPSLQ